MSPPLAPRTPAELAEALRATPRALPIGARTKARLAQAPAGCTLISTLGLSGIVEYEPSEFTFTARAGTPVREIAATLAAQGQYLPFDPLLGEAGATLGGTVASGLSGPGRFRYGGLRDFILGVQFADGEGRLLRLGGKVVKNAAGFDLPKFFVGSLGRYGVLTELSFKVFPRAAAFRTVRIPFADPAEMTTILLAAGRTRWELDALDASPAEGAVYARIGGPEAALEGLSAEILARHPGGTLLSTDQAEAWWREVGEVGWAHEGGGLVKVALEPQRLAALGAAAAGARMHVSAGGNVAYLSWPGPVDAAALTGFDALTLRGPGPLFPGRAPVELPAVRAALDPHGRFAELA